MICRVESSGHIVSPVNTSDGLKHILSSDSEFVYHDDHFDVVVNGQLHYPAENHFEDHGVYDPEVHKNVTTFAKNIRNIVYRVLLMFDDVGKITNKPNPQM